MGVFYRRVNNQTDGQQLLQRSLEPSVQVRAVIFLENVYNHFATRVR